MPLVLFSFPCSLFFFFIVTDVTKKLPKIEVNENVQKEHLYQLVVFASFRAGNFERVVGMCSIWFGSVRFTFLLEKRAIPGSGST